jgi:hypothetical protein
MTHATPPMIAAALTALDQESALWTEQGERLRRVVNQVSSLRITGMGRTIIFDGFLDAYEAVTQVYIGRCAGGRDAARSIAQTLAAVRATYAAEEARNLHAQQRLY